MKKIKNLAKVLVVVMLGIYAQTLLWSGTALATSDYDDVVQSVESLHLSRNGTSQGAPACSPVDMTTRWQNVLNDDAAWWSGGQYIGGATREYTQSDFAAALSNGTWAVSQLIYSNGAVTGTGDQSIADAVRIVFSPSSTSYVDFSTYQGQKYAVMRNTDGAPVYAVVIQFHDPDGGSSSNACTPLVTQSLRESGVGDGWFLENKGVAGRPTDDSYVVEPLSVNAQTIYPPSYAGVYFSNDADGDGVVATKETAQGTSDSNKDSDGDGLNDYIESQWYANRQAVFCGMSCGYPNPIGKDVFVEVDWMKNGSRVIKPTQTQLDSVIASYASQGITAHFDTGQYGGGNELPTYVNELYFESDPNNLDFYDLKNGNGTYSANFNTNRSRIWHYMISADKMKFKDPDNPTQYITTSSGVSFSGDDDLSIAVGHIEDDQASFGYTSLDTAISGTVLHEVGHNLCLSKGTYTGQSTGCQYGGVDIHAGQSYVSSMNYDKQMFQVDYSHGANGAPNDHDDWVAVLDGGIADFANTDRNAGDTAGVSGKEKKSKKLVRGITSEEAKALKKASKLGK